MPKRAFLILALFASVFITASPAFAQKVSADKIVAVVGSSNITYSELVQRKRELVENRRKQGYTSDRDPMNEALEELLLQKLLYNQALIDSVGQHTAGSIAHNVENRVSMMIEESGSISALEAKEGKSIYDIREDLRRSIEEAQLAYLMRGEVISRVRITPGEVERFYKSMEKDKLPVTPEKYMYAQIVKYPQNIKEAKQRTRERLLEMRERIINGTRFDMLARMYSEDMGTAMQGGEMDYMPLDGLVKPYSEALSRLQPGQVSEVVETEFGFHIIQLIAKKGALYKSRHILLKPSFTDEELREGLLFLDSLASQIRSGATTFEKAAKEYSEDKYSKQNGGIVTNHEMLERYGATDTSYSTIRFSKEELGGDYNVIRNLKAGDISGAHKSYDMSGNVLSKIIKLVEVIPSHTVNLKDDYLEVEQAALIDKQEKEFRKWLDGKIASMYIRIAPEFHGGNFENKNWVK